MIELYSGTPGSGKSLRAAYKIIEWLKTGKPVIANFPIDMGYFKKRAKRGKPVGRFYYVPNEQLTSPELRTFSFKHLERGKENQCLVVIDECAVLFNPRSWQETSRMDWINFFLHHRKYGYTFVLIAQGDNLIDKQIRPRIETEWKHKSLKHYGLIGLLAYLICGGLFVAVEMWSGTKSVISKEWFFLNRRKANIYNSFKLFDDDMVGKLPEDIETIYDNMAIPVPKDKPRRGGLKRKRKRRRRARRAV